MSAEWPTQLPAEALPVADAYIEAYAQSYDTIIPGLGDALRTVWADIRPTPTCDCPLNPHHDWNCSTTPIWAQTIRDLDVNPWTVTRSAMWVLEGIRPEIRVNRFVWQGSRDRACGRGPCCLGDNHDGRCRI